MEPLPDNWTCHIAPSGHKYYYNTLTKESTYTKPIVDRNDQRNIPLFKVPLVSQWSLVITNIGDHFFYDESTGESYWTIDDDEVEQFIDKLNKDDLVLLIARARGLELDTDMLLKLEDLTSYQRDYNKYDHIVRDDENYHEPNKQSLVGGYLSSDDESESSGENDENDENDVNSNEDQVHRSFDENVESSGDENGVNIDDFSSDDEDSETVLESASPHAATVFNQLLEESNINPFNPWHDESLKLANDVRFMSITKDRVRKQLFDQWCEDKIAMSRQSDDIAKLKHDVSPIVLYLRYLESLERPLDRLYSRFKALHRDGLTAFNDIGERKRETIYKEYVILISKPLSMRVEIFINLLRSSKSFMKQLTQNREFLQSPTHYHQSVQWLINNTSDHRDSIAHDHLYPTLDRIEKELNVPDVVRLNPKYYIVDAATRIQLLKQLLLQ